MENNYYTGFIYALVFIAIVYFVTDMFFTLPVNMLYVLIGALLYFLARHVYNRTR